jgi:cell wall-associated NlpC family hydrolase
LSALVFTCALAGNAQAADRAQTHVVVAGETLSAIAATEHVSVADLARINQIAGTQALSPGTVLAIDDAASEREAPPTTFTISPQVRAQLAAAEASADATSANADLRMWGADIAAVGAGSKPAVATAQQPGDPIHRFARGIISRTSSLAMSLTRNAMRFIGTPYVFGGTSPSGFDCSGYTQHVFAMLGIAIPRTADSQFYAGHPTIGGIQPGDLVFFQTYLPGPSHVGIYIGGGRFIHSSSHGVRISALRESYWASRYLGAKRVVAFR